MAIDYTKWAADMGELIERFNGFRTLATGQLTTDLSEILTEYKNSGADNLLDGMTERFDSYRDILLQWAADMGQLANARMADSALMASQMPFPETSDPQGIVEEFIRQMIEDSKTVDASTVTVNSPAYNASNYGDGLFYASKVLDGYNEPGDGMPAVDNYNAVNSELALNETFVFTCRQDSEGAGTLVGAEEWSWHGDVQGEGGYYDWRREGSGQRAQGLRGAMSTTLLSNGDFESFTSSAPDSWDLDVGTAGSTVDDDDTNEFRGTNCLKFLGTGAVAPQISQTLTTMNPKRRYYVHARVKSTLIVAETGTLLIQFEGTGYTAGGSEKISIAPGSYSGTYVAVGFYINTPEEMPDDWELVIKTSGSITNARAIWIDDVIVVPVEYWGGIGVVPPIPGSTKWLRGDRVTIEIDNDQAGVFQEFFRRWYKMQLPSNAAGGETVSDAGASD